MRFSKLSEVANVIDSLHKTPKYSDIGQSMVRCTDVKYGELKLSKTFKVDEEVFEQFSKRYKPSLNDIIITRVGSYGNTAIVTDTNFCLGQNTSAIVPKDINARYLYLALNSPIVKNQIEFSVVGSTQKTLSLKAINNLEIPRFYPKTENEIAKVTGELDEKIELNRQTNQTLEHIAQALFKSWFVDFEPTRAKIAAQQAGQDPERAAMAAISGKTVAALDQLDTAQLAKLEATAALFPDGLVESELGEMPEGWEVATLSDVANIVMGHSPKGETYNGVGKGMPLVNGPVEFGNYHTKKIKWTTAPTRLSSKRDLIVCVRGSTTGRFVKSDGVYCLGRGVCAIQADFSQPFADYLFKSEIPVLLGMTTGSTFPSWNGPVLRKHKIVKPSDELIKAFSTIVESIELKISKLEAECEWLTETRNTLLPKLLSGELSPTQTEVA